jgi:hypothetical protein
VSGGNRVSTAKGAIDSVAKLVNKPRGKGKVVPPLHYVRRFRCGHEN